MFWQAEGMHAAPTKAQLRAATDRVRGWLLTPINGFPAVLHWLTHTEQVGLDLGAQRDAWLRLLPTLSPDQHTDLRRGVQRLTALLAQLRTRWLQYAREILADERGNGPAEQRESPWHAWLHLILDGALEQPSPARAAQLKALNAAYQRWAATRA